MKRALCLAAVAVMLPMALPAQQHAELSQIQTVYVLKMRGGFDQHLANNLTAGAFYRVVTDPLKADAIFTDRVGKGFEDTVQEIYAPPPPEKPEKEEEAESDSSTSTTPNLKASERPRAASFGGNTSTVFLVDRRSHQVVWSTYARPKNYSSKEMNLTAKDVVDRLNLTIQGKK